jgi:uncharacterized coiled-coil protein SlyX
MGEETIDVPRMILAELREIKGEVRLIPKLQAQVDALRASTQQLDTAMRESTAALQTQATAHNKIIDELRLQVHQSTAAMMGISNDVQSLTARMKDVEKQSAAAFQQQMQLARDVRDAAGFPDPEEYKSLQEAVATLPELREDVGIIKIHLPWLNGIEWFLRILLYALASAAVVGLLWLLGRALTNSL